MAPNAITDFVLNNFGHENLAQKAISFVLTALSQKSFAESAAVILETLSAAMWQVGTNGPNKAEIDAGTAKTRSILEKYGLSEVDPAKFFAGVVVSAKYLHEKSALNGLRRLR